MSSHRPAGGLKSKNVTERPVRVGPGARAIDKNWVGQIGSSQGNHITEERIASRLKNSGAGAQPNVTTKQGEGAQRVYHNIHGAGHPIAPGTQPPKDAGR